MFMQMKNRRRYQPEPCGCNGSCACHKPSSDGEVFPWIIPLAFPLLIPLLFPLGFVWFIISLPAAPVHHIEVDGKDCIIKVVSEHCTSTGACSSHDVAVCPKVN